MAGLVPAIHVFGLAGKKDVDARDKPGHDGGYLYRSRNFPEAMRGSFVTGQL